MKVSLLNDSFPPVIDGVANVVMNYANIMTEEKLADVCVATPRYPGADYNIYPYYVIPYQSFDTTKIVKGYRAGNPFDFSEMKDLVDFKPDLIHSHCPVASTFLARMLRAQTDVPIVFTYHTKFDEDIARAVKSETLQKETIKVLVSNVEACDEVWVVSEGAGENLKALGYQGDYRVVSNGVDFAKGRVDAKTVAEVMKDYDLPKDVPMFLFVGRIISYKGIPLIIDAMAKLSAAGKDFRMVFVGGGPDADMMKEKARQLGIYENPDSSHPGKCIFTGPIYDRNVLRAFNTRADLFLFPSTYDTNGIVVREAAACGLASMLIEGSCAAEGITDNRNGFLVKQDAEDIFQLLYRISDDLDHIHQVGQNAMDEIYISWQDSVHAAHERYGEIIEMKKSGILVTKHRSLTDYIQNMPVEIYQETQDYLEKYSNRLDHAIDDISENINQFSNQIYSEVYQTFHEMKQGIREDFHEMHMDFHDAKEEIKAGFHETKEGIKADFHEMKDGISEMKQGIRADFHEMHMELHDVKEGFKEEIKKMVTTDEEQ